MSIPQQDQSQTVHGVFTYMYEPGLQIPQEQGQMMMQNFTLQFQDEN